MTEARENSFILFLCPIRYRKRLDTWKKEDGWIKMIQTSWAALTTSRGRSLSSRADKSEEWNDHNKSISHTSSTIHKNLKMLSIATLDTCPTKRKKERRGWKKALAVLAVAVVVTEIVVVFVVVAVVQVVVRSSRNNNNDNNNKKEIKSQLQLQTQTCWWFALKFRSQRLQRPEILRCLANDMLPCMIHTEQ